MAESRGKKFEGIVKESINSLPNCWLLRLYDATDMFKSVNNPCDFVGSINGTMVLIECKSIEGNRLNFKSDIRINQWEGMIEAMTATCGSVNPIVAYVLTWFVDKDVTMAFNIKQLEYLKFQGNKSVAWDNTDCGILVPAKKKRTYFEYDFSVLGGKN
jgi:hypothetical protein